MLPALFHDFEESFPKYNVIKNSDDEITIELALAGYKTEDLDISVQNNILQVQGKKAQTEKNFLKRGISERSFSKQWSFPRNVDVSQAQLENGILTIVCRLEIPKKVVVQVVNWFRTFIMDSTPSEYSSK